MWNSQTSSTKSCVPNAPCGVESVVFRPPVKPRNLFLMHRVELKADYHRMEGSAWALFLMHRVELKVSPSGFHICCPRIVPNAPCGVESHDFPPKRWLKIGFLMHRVELKGPYLCGRHRNGQVVPNAPCGVERLRKTN